MSAILVDPSGWQIGEPFNDHDALARLIVYARDEADRNGHYVCAELLAAALLMLEDSAGRPAHPETSTIGLAANCS